MDLILKYLVLAVAVIFTGTSIICFTGPLIFPKKYKDEIDVKFSFAAGVILALISWLFWYSFFDNVLLGISFCLLIVTFSGILFFSCNMDFRKGVRKYYAFILGTVFMILLAIGSFWLFVHSLKNI